ncbi:MAG: ferritin-like domain-containing protein, partial [Edaphobacter sp.]
MATPETQQIDEVIVNSRRKMMTIGGAALAALILGSTTKAEAQSAVTDNDILNFALNLEYLEAQFYTLAVYGVTIDKLTTPIPISVNGGTGGTVTLSPAFTKVPFALPTIAAYAMETAIEEGKHVKFLQGALGTKAVSMPNINLFDSFNTLATAA